MKNTLLFLLVSTITTGLLVPVLQAAEFRCATAEIAPLLPVPDWDNILKNIPSPETRTRIEYNVGDQRIFWTWDFSVMPPDFNQTPSTCRAKGDNGYVWVEDTQWNVNIFESNVQGVFEAWENATPADSVDPNKGIFEIVTDSFGPVPDILDGDPRVHILFYDIESFMGTSFDGFFNAFDQMTEAQAQGQGQHSNECEIVYLDADGMHSPDHPYMLGVLAHEFQHMIHWLADNNETTWVNEGCSQLAWYLCGYGTDGWETYFANHPNNDLLDFDVSGSYGQVFLFFLYMYQQFGGIDSIRTVAADSANGFEGIISGFDTMGYTFDTQQVVRDWCVANQVDDPTLDRGQYGYMGYDPPTFKLTSTFDTYPTGSQDATIQRYAARYYRLQSGAPQLNVTVNDMGYDVSALAARHKNGAYFPLIPVDPAFQRCQMTLADDQTMDLVVVNTDSADTQISITLEGTQGNEPDDTPPYVVLAGPVGVECSAKVLYITLMDVLSEIDASSVSLTVNGTPVVDPLIMPMTGNKTMTVQTSLSEYYPDMAVSVELTVNDVNGFQMTPFTMNFRMGDSMGVATGVTLTMPAFEFAPGDVCYLFAGLGNVSEAITDVPFFVLLDVFGTFYSAPEWKSIDESLSWYEVDLPTGYLDMRIIPVFTWPEGTGTASGLMFYGAMTNAAMTDLMGGLGTVPFGWGE